MLKKLGLEGWFAAHFAYGIVQIVFIPMLMPSFILARTGSATQAGLAMAVFGMLVLLRRLLVRWLINSKLTDMHSYSV
ncbi:hypothetical protein JCM19240_3768 [Vibrio maritimus]|uniref:Uncharacterized protein n=1 Tax=Vibrio maritimus TaxID=990268 RepID=A0A090TDT3_9VIBR|nr:hypothetical protein JCM19240_3768 [Vibrio maritimus]